MHVQWDIIRHYLKGISGERKNFWLKRVEQVFLERFSRSLGWSYSIKYPPNLLHKLALRFHELLIIFFVDHSFFALQYYTCLCEFLKLSLILEILNFMFIFWIVFKIKFSKKLGFYFYLQIQCPVNRKKILNNILKLL